MEIVELIVCAIISFCLGALLCGGCSANAFQKQAVNAGAAEFYLDQKFERQFRWKTNHLANPL